MQKATRRHSPAYNILLGDNGCILRVIGITFGEAADPCPSIRIAKESDRLSSRCKFVVDGYLWSDNSMKRTS